MGATTDERLAFTIGETWQMTSVARAHLVAFLAKLEAESELATAVGEYRLARLFLWERERMRLILHPPSAATAGLPPPVRRGGRPTSHDL